MKHEKGESVMGSRQFSQKQRMAILYSAAEIGVKRAVELASVHNTSVYDWRRQLKSLGNQMFLGYKPSYPGRGVKQISAKQKKPYLKPRTIIPVLVPGR